MGEIGPWANPGEVHSFEASTEHPGDVGPPTVPAFGSVGQAVLVGAAVGAAVGGAVGAIIGMVTGEESTEAASTEAKESSIEQSAETSAEIAEITSVRLEVE